jgi:hypothetical protein
MVARVRLKSISERVANNRGVLRSEGKGTVIMTGKDDGAPDLVCGECDAPLLTGVPLHAVRSMVFSCKHCGAFNDTRIDSFYRPPPPKRPRRPWRKPH